MSRTAARVEVSRGPEALAHRAAKWITDLAADSRDRFAVCLSGGSTPRRLYELLGESPYREALPWERIHWFWGDERFVPWDHPDSNYRMVRDALLAQAPAPPQNIHGVTTTGTPAEAARAYEEVLKSYYGSETLVSDRLLFDIQILGLGPDGHTASLFPGTKTLDERHRWVVEVIGARSEPRITLTYPTLESSKHTAFLVAGAEKREMLTRAVGGDETVPAARIRPAGELIWFADEAATPSKP